MVQSHYKLVQLMQIDVGKKRRHNAALRGTTVSFVVFPIFQISSFQEFVNQLYNTGIFDFTLNQTFIKAPLDVPLHELPHTVEFHFQ